MIRQRIVNWVLMLKFLTIEIKLRALHLETVVRA